jgi:hypothetical protein
MGATMTDKPNPPLKRSHIKLISSATEIMEEPARVGDKTFAPRLLAITTFPHQQPKDNPEAWTRRNGRALLTVRPGWDAKKRKRLPYPSGSIPRLLTVYLCREAKRAEYSHLSGMEMTASFTMCSHSRFRVAARPAWV